MNDEVSEDRRAITNYALCILETFNCEYNLIPQRYNSIFVITSNLYGGKKKKKIERVLTHRYGHKLNLVLTQSAKIIPECKSF